MRSSLFSLLILLTLQSVAQAIERVTFERDGRKRVVAGEVLIEAEDGGVLLHARDGVFWVVQPEELKARSKDRQPFQMLPREQLEARLLEEMPAGFKIQRTAHYTICYNTTPVYAKWCGALYERLYRGFFGYWRKRGLKLREPDYPLVALVFDNQLSYAEQTRREIGEGTKSIIGYYSMKTNRVNMYDLTGADGIASGQRRIASSQHINQILSRPEAERLVATIVHEATHQLAYNSGLQTRYAGNPFWVSEGLAVYFESPDLRSSKGWRGIGSVNRYNLLQFRGSLGDRADGALEKLIGEDAQFRSSETAGVAYGEAWALSYFLIKTRPRKYVEYLTTLSKLPPLAEVPAKDRVQQFKDIFGSDLRALDSDFLRYMRRVR